MHRQEGRGTLVELPVAVKMSCLAIARQSTTGIARWFAPRPCAAYTAGGPGWKSPRNQVLPCSNPAY